MCCVSDDASAVGAWWERHANILWHRGGKGREECVYGETTPRFLQVPTQALSLSSLMNWSIMLLKFFPPTLAIREGTASNIFQRVDSCVDHYAYYIEATDDNYFSVNLYAIQEKCNLYEYSDQWK